MRLRLRYGSRGDTRRTAWRPRTESRLWLVLLFLRFGDFLFIGTFLAEASKLTAHIRTLPHFADECVQQESRTALPAVWFASHPNDGGAVVETWARAADALQARPELKLEPVHRRTKGEAGEANVDF